MELLIIASFFGLISGLICAIIANGKNRSETSWFFAGFFFGIFALFAACFASKLPFRLNRYESKRCYYCQTVIDIRSMACAHCTRYQSQAQIA